MEINLQKKLQEKLEPYIHGVMESQDIPGLSIAVVKEGDIVYANAFGVKNIQTQEPVTTRTVFHQGSISKVFVGAGIMQLVEQENIQLDASVADYLPYFTLADERYKQITIRHLLNHTSGLGDVDDYEWDKPEYDEEALERFVRSLQHERLHSLPGEVFSYSSTGYEVLGAVIANISGVTFETYMKERILSPLGMNDSTFFTPEVSRELQLSGHTRKEMHTMIQNIYPYHRAHAPSSTLQSNSVDMCRWLMATLNKGHLDGTTILYPSSYDALWAPSMKLDEEESIGLAWFIMQHRGDPLFCHNGADDGFLAIHGVIPEKSLGVAVSVNNDSVNSGMTSVFRAAYDIAYGCEPAAPVHSLQ